MLHSAIVSVLSDMGYEVNQRPYAVIERCDRWYRADEEMEHARVRVNGEKYEMLQMGFAKRACADDANLCEVVEINAGGEGPNARAQFEAVNGLLDQNAFQTQYRRQLELCAAEGTAACYWRVEGAEEYRNPDGSKCCRGGTLKLTYIEAGGFVPLSAEGGEVTEAAFAGDSLIRGERRHVLVVCTREREDAAAERGGGANAHPAQAAFRYAYRTVTFDEGWRVLSDERDVLGPVRPFAVMRVAAVNHLRGMEGFGLPKIAAAIPVLRALDMAFTALYGDIDTSEKLVLVNEVLCNFKRVVSTVDGVATEQLVPITPNEQLRQRFVMLGADKLPSADSVVKEIVPEIRAEKFRGVIELLLSMLSMLFGYGTRRYSFERGQIATATEYIGERQDQMQELNRQRQEARRYIADLTRAGLWFMNAFLGTEWDVDAPVLVEFDDSYVTDRPGRLRDMRDDVLAGIGGRYVRELYLRERYNLTEKEAAAWADAGRADGA